MNKQPAPFTFRPYQKDDIARLAMHDGGILGWDPGMGKTIAMFTWPQLKADGAPLRCLIVAPEGLHEQIIAEGASKFGATVRRLGSQEDFLDDATLQKARSEILGTGESAVSGWWLTSYSQLGYNGGDEWQGKEDDEGEMVVTRKILKERAATGTTGAFAAGIGAAQRGIRCINRPTLATLATAGGELFNCVVCDEAVRLKSNDSYQSIGVRRLAPRWRMVLTGTPVKNFLDDFFWLAQWACGGSPTPTARFPYAATTEAREEFANAHMVIEQNHTAEEAAAKAGRRRKVQKRIPQLTNVHRLWKLIGPVVIRRRKEDVGGIQPKTVIPIKVKPGTAQHAVYRWHCENPPDTTKDGREMSELAQVLAQLTALRIAALCPGSTLLGSAAPTAKQPEPLRIVSGNNGYPYHELSDRSALVQWNHKEWMAYVFTDGAPAVATWFDTEQDAKHWLQARLAERLAARPASPTCTRRSWTPWTPKLAACLSLISQRIAEGERIVVMSPFQDFGRTLKAMLDEARVSSILLDGDTSPARRGRLAAEFKAGRHAVLIGGIQSMGEGHSFECARSLILPSLDWAFDKNAQAEDRVHRITSGAPVDIYTLVTEGTIDERLADVYREKADAANIALDGGLIERKTGELNLGDLLRDALASFDDKADTLDEQDIEGDWEKSGRARLAMAMQKFREWHPPIVPDSTGRKTPARDIQRAADAANDALNEIREQANVAQRRFEQAMARLMAL